MLDGITVERVEGCRQLLREFDGQRHELERTLATRALSDHQVKAFAMLDSPRLARAFDLEEEPSSLRGKYRQHCQQRYLCLSCHQKWSLLMAERIAQSICQPVPHRQIVWTIWKRLCIFLPSFILFAITNSIICRLRRWRWTSAFLDGVTAATMGLMAAVTVKLGMSIFCQSEGPLGISWPGVLIAVAAVFRYKVEWIWIVLGDAAVGALISVAGIAR